MRLWLAACIVALALPVSARWSDQGAARVRSYAGEIHAHAASYGVNPSLLAGLLVHESQMTAIQGGTRAECFGPGQIHWLTWGPILRGQGIAQQAEDLLDVHRGVEAAAAVLGAIRALHPRAADWKILCLYGTGSKALKFNESCSYSRAVLANVKRAATAMR